MLVKDTDTLTYEVRETIARFDTAARFEAAVDALAHRGIPRDAINMIASHDAVQKALGHVHGPAGDIRGDDGVPQTLYEDSRDIRNEQVLAVGLPVYIGGAAAGLAIVATGGTLAFGALMAAAGAAAGGSIGALVARSIGDRHAKAIEDQLKMGALLITVEVRTKAEERDVTALLAASGGRHILTHTITRSTLFDQHALSDFNPYDVSYPYF